MKFWDVLFRDDRGKNAQALADLEIRPIVNDTVVGLANKNIIYIASNTGFVYSHGAYYPYTISDFAEKYLNNELLELPRNPTEDQIKQIIQKRPEWAKERTRIENLFKRHW
ncbi:hypothetical protein [Arcticibacterium luteifluviistationis]|uniref:hypothetical protein n=1 Tax=Arcticibacterium luteifluviistationis TaxID=1784714 RepID=UPI00195505D5|nr:hypothetical protein [Arcticibacterium luteifluviistationis]